VGYLVMFILLDGVVLMYMFAEDKEKKQLTRISASPISVTRYLCGHSLFTFTIIYLPTLIVLYLVKFIMNVDIGYCFSEYAALLAVITAFATAFSLFLNAFSKKGDTANMAGSSIVMMSSILAGSFYSFEKGNKILETIIQILPQKAYLALAEGVERGHSFTVVAPKLLYILGLAAVFFAIGVIKTRRDYVGSN
jgi:ABC-2 type transport system permease protein